MTFSIPAALRAHSRPFQPIGWIVGVMSKVRDWTVDRQRERRIRELRASVSLAFAFKDARAVAELSRELFAECDARSPAQVKRMEKRLLDRMDPHARAVFERVRQ